MLWEEEMRLYVLTAVALLGFETSSLAQDDNPVLPFFNIVGGLIEQKITEEGIKNSPEYRNQEIQPGGLTRGQVIVVQQKLIDRGFDVGAPDGIIGPKTMAVVATLQHQAGVPVTGYPTAQILEALLQQ
jgi:peptidoglycan hydrolase-like protein with peptidoglycan-binding domain